MISVFSSKLNDLHAWNSCSHVLPNFEYLCLNKFCNCSHVILSKVSKDWNHSLASPSSVRQNLCTLTSSIKWWAFIQSLEHSRCASASSSGFPENSGLKLDQFICKCHCPAASWFCCCWLCCWFCPCLWLDAAAPSSLSAIFTLTYNLLILICCIIFLFPLSIPDVINLLLSNFNLSQMLEFDDSFFLFLETMSLTTGIFFFLSTACPCEAAFSYFWNLNSSPVKFVKLIFLKSFISSETSILSDEKISIGISFLILGSWMSPHVMYGSVVCFLGMSRGIGSSEY